MPSSLPQSEAKTCLPPVVDEHVQLLICGSLPGEASLKAERYYAHPRNHFWRLLEGVLNQPLADLPYDERLSVLLARGVGLWDTVAAAQREGSLDGAMRGIETSPLAEMAGTLPSLRAVAFNGGTAAKLGWRALEGSGVVLIDLPSSSPAYTLPLVEKAQRWAALRPFARPR